MMSVAVEAGRSGLIRLAHGVVEAGLTLDADPLLLGDRQPGAFAGLDHPEDVSFGSVHLVFPLMRATGVAMDLQNIINGTNCQS